MRKLTIALPVLLLSGCINDSATYYADATREHTLTVRRQQDYFWSEEARYTLMAARLPDCQRQIPLGEMPLEDVKFQLFASGDKQWSLRAGRQVWQVETQGCSLLSESGEAAGELLGTYRARGTDMVFVPAREAAPAAPAESPADAAGASPAEPPAP